MMVSLETLRFVVYVSLLAQGTPRNVQVWALPRSESQADSIQDLLNKFCQRYPSHQGCQRLPPRNPLPGQGGCSPGSRPCSDTNNLCLPVDIPCSYIGSPETCPMPVSSRADAQTLVCGDGSQDVRCERGGQALLLTEVLVQCRGYKDKANSVHRLGFFTPDEDGGGAGIYRCMKDNQWVPTYEGTPILSDLLAACYYAGCGRYYPPSSPATTIHQLWPFVVNIIDAQDVQICLGVLVDTNAVLTAAHCVTKSLLSTEAVGSREIKIALPPQSPDRTIVTIQPYLVKIHPAYQPDNFYANDVAILKFSTSGETRPHACVPPDIVRYTRPDGVIFHLDNSSYVPTLKFSAAKYSFQCSIQAPSCRIRPPPSQYCIHQPSLDLGPGSSGSPYLSNNNAQSLDNIWTVMGIKTRAHRANRNCNFNHMYTDIYELRGWVANCVIRNNC